MLISENALDKVYVQFLTVDVINRRFLFLDEPPEEPSHVG
jgi:hypothetical protein